MENGQKLPFRVKLNQIFFFLNRWDVCNQSLKTKPRKIRRVLSTLELFTVSHWLSYPPSPSPCMSLHPLAATWGNITGKSLASIENYQEGGEKRGKYPVWSLLQHYNTLTNSQFQEAFRFHCENCAKAKQQAHSSGLNTQTFKTNVSPIYVVKATFKIIFF